MARAKTPEQSRSRSKAAMIEDLTRGTGELQEFLAQMKDLGREGFPYLDAARARAELKFRECIRRTFGEKSQEFQEYRQHKLLMDGPEEMRQSIALIKTLIASLEQKKLDLQAGPAPQQTAPKPTVASMPTGPQIAVVPASISTVQMQMTQSAPVAPPPVVVAVAMATNLDQPAAAVPNPSPLPAAPSAFPRQPESPNGSSPSLPEPSPVSPAPTAPAMLHPTPQPVDRVAQDLDSSPARTAQNMPEGLSHADSPPQLSRSKPESTVHTIPSTNPEPVMQEAPLAPTHTQPQPTMSIGASPQQGLAPQVAQAGSDPVEGVKALCCRFHSVARQLRLRGEYRPTLSVEDELDVQDLLHALLRIQFDDIGTEEWTPGYAEGAARTTFLLNDNRLAVLVKKTRNGLTAKDLTEQLRVDAERYRTKSRCTSLLCFIYDPEGRIGNPRALETSLSTVSDSLTIDVLVIPK
jgi:hypothetical protein